MSTAGSRCLVCLSIANPQITLFCCQCPESVFCPLCADAAERELVHCPLCQKFQHTWVCTRHKKKNGFYLDVALMLLMTVNDCALYSVTMPLLGCFVYLLFGVVRELTLAMAKDSGIVFIRDAETRWWYRRLALSYESVSLQVQMLLAACSIIASLHVDMRQLFLILWGAVSLAAFIAGIGIFQIISFCRR